MRHSLFASFAAVCFVPTLSAPALAAHHGHGYRYRYAAHHVAWHRVMPVRAESFGRDVYAYAPAMQTRRTIEDSWQQNAWRQNNWRQNNWQENNWSRGQQYGEIDGMAAAQASANGIPASLVARVIKRESGGNPRAVSRGNYGLMQIRLGTARAMGFTGSAAELLDPQVNMTYAVRYLAGAYRAANGNENRAVALYASGYYAQAKQQGFSPYGSASSAPQPWSGFASQPGGFNTGEAYNAPVYRVRHTRHRAV